MSRPTYRAFSLVEILIVVMILGILAAIAIPKMSNAAQLARENSMKTDLQQLRTQLGVYKSQHAVYPGYPNGDSNATPTMAAIQDQLLKFSSSSGATSTTRSALYQWGPYLDAMPTNAINSKSDWKILADSDAITPDDTTGWLYQPSTGIIKPNNSGTDSAGRPIIDY